MKEAKRFLIVLFLGVFVVMTTGFSPAHACSCFGLSAEQAFQRSDVVFTGTVTTITPPPAGSVRSTASPEKVTFRVLNVSKGAASSPNGTIVVTTAVSDVSCGYPFQNGGQYLVFARYGSDASGQSLQTDLCSGTQPVVVSQVVTVTLTSQGQSSAQAATSLSSSSTTSGTNQLTASGFEVVVLLAAAVLTVVAVVWYSAMKKRGD
jgi:hypothetical protein